MIHLPLIEMAFRWQADGGLILNVGLAALGSGPVLLRYPIPL